MPLREVARIRLPTHSADGGFDHAAVHAATSRLYVAHTSNDCVEVVDLASRRFLHSLRGLRGVAGIWVSEERGVLFTSNRGEDTASIFDLPKETERFRIATGSRPNGIAFDPVRQSLLVAGVGNPETGAPPTATFFDSATGRKLSELRLPGRTRWATYQKSTDSFLVNIADPPEIASIPGGGPWEVSRVFPIPAVGPHGLEQDPGAPTIYCAADEGKLVTVDLRTGNSRVVAELVGAPDVMWLNRRLGHLYVAIGDPGVVQVFRTATWEHIETFPTSAQAHTLTVDPVRGEVHIFLPGAHEDLVLHDSVEP